MKKKIYSIIAAFMILFACMFTGACGDKYKNMEFRVMYAFTENAPETDWIDGSEGISLNYTAENLRGEGGDTSLVFDQESGVANLYVKIEVKNVKKKKYIDSITVSFSSLGGLNFSSKRVKQDEVFSVPITGNVDTVLKLYENNSRKKSEVPFVVSRTLEAIEVDLSKKPAMPAINGAALSLISLGNLKYIPEHKTNQIGVTYSIAGIGKYVDGAFIQKHTMEDAEAYFAIENGLLKIIADPTFFSSDACVVKIKATSIYHDGVEDSEDLIEAEFDVYLVDGAIESPVVKFTNEESVDNIQIYENGNDYSTTTIQVVTTPLDGSIYQSGVNTHVANELIKYSTAIYVLNGSGEYERYKFGSIEHQEGINGLLIDDYSTLAALSENQFKFSIANRTFSKNSIKVVYELDGLDFSYTQYTKPQKNIEVEKKVLPTCITVNDSLDLTNGDSQNAVIYGTNSAGYKGLPLKLVANPNDDPNRRIVLTDEKSGLIVANGNGKVISGSVVGDKTVYDIVDGTTVYIKFKDNIIEEQTLKIKTLKIPTSYDGKTVVYDDNDESNFIVATYVLTKVVTANAVEFVDANNDVTSNFILDAENDGNIFVKVYYTGVRLDGSTVTLKSNNNNILFKNVTTEISISDCVKVGGGSNATDKFDIYSVVVKKPNGKHVGNITVVAGGGNIGVEKTATISSVYLSDSNVFTVKAQTNNIKTFDIEDMTAEPQAQYNNSVDYFAIAEGEFAEFKVVDAHGSSKTISKLEIEKSEDENDYIKTNMIRHYNIISNSMFDVTTTSSGGYTQILTLKLYYYAFNDNIIEEFSVHKEIQIAVYEGIDNIRSESKKSMVGYVNQYYNETAETEVEFDSLTADAGTPASYVVFKGDEDKLVAPHASQIKISINNFAVLKEFSDNFNLNFVSEDGLTTISLKDLSETTLNKNAVDFLKGKIKLNLLGDMSESINSISFSITALRFGEVSNVVSNVDIKIAKVDRADRILVSGNSLKQISDNLSEMTLSFIDVADNGYDEATFNASIQFDEEETANSLRFTNIETALTHVLYKYETDKFGNILTNQDGSLKAARVPDSDLNVTYYNGTISVRAIKSAGGGKFKLVLVAKDSYSPNLDLVEDEKDFKTKYEITVVVEDGILAPFSIREAEELLYINNNLDKNFVIAAHLDLRSIENFEPLGWVAGTVNPFQGTLTGVTYTPIGDNEIVSTEYSITMNIETSLASTEYGDIYGLFGIIGEHAIVKDLKLNAYLGEYNGTLTKGLKVGSLAAVNKGLISNIDVSLFGNAEYVVIKSAGAVVDFGGIVALNDAIIEKSHVECENKLTIKSGINVSHNIGLVAGTNTATISGSYEGKESLDNFVFDVIANLEVYNTCASYDWVYNIGAVVGLNNQGTIKNLLVGGLLEATEDHNEIQKGYLGGLVGSSTAGTIETSVAMSLDLISTTKKLNVAGVVGVTDGTEIKNVKFVSAITKFNNSWSTAGFIKGNATVAGIVASANDGSIINSSVESFVETVDNQIYGIIDGTFYALQNGSTVAGIANASGTTISKSFVRANIKTAGSIVLTSNETETNTYFIGKVDGTVSTDNTNGYSVVNNVIKIQGVELTDDCLTGGELDTSKWELKWTALTNYENVWKLQENYNVYIINDVEYFFPYLLETGKAIMIVAPRSISANVNEKYVTEANSVHVIEYDYDKYSITESTIVNFINGAGDKANTYKLVSDKDDVDKTSKNNGLFDIDILPEDAQGGYAFEILGTGRNFAYINSEKEIVFTGVSGSIPILIRIYSVFNAEIEIYVSVYSQHLLTNLKLNSNYVNYSGYADYQYEMSAFSGQSNIILTMTAENEFEGKKGYTTIFDVYNLKQYLSVVATSNVADSLLEINAGKNYSSITVKVKEETVIPAEYSEIITFSLCLNKDYFGSYVGKDGPNKNFITADEIEIATIKLKVYLYNSAKTIEVDGEDEEKTTHDDISFDVYLTTDYVDKNATQQVENLVVREGYIEFEDYSNRDSIRIAFEIVEGQDEVDALLETNGLKYFAELFDLSSAVISMPYLTRDDQKKVVGYEYKVLLELKDSHYYRYINDNIKFNIVVYATSKADTVNSENDPIEIVLKPAVLSTTRIENYKVKSLKVNTDYTNIVTNNDIQTSIIEPGSLGNVMMIYLEPTYSNVKSASIKTSELFVPSLGKTVKMKFTQLALDYRKNNKGQFTTLYGADVSAQVDDTLELKLVSQIDKDGNRVYNGVICVYIQLEKFGGLEDTMSIELNVETSDGRIVTRTRELLTTYLPGTQMIYDEERLVDNGYLIQKATSNNEVKVKIYGYEFNSNPQINVRWELTDIANLQYVDADHKAITDTDQTNTYYIGDYVSYYLLKDFDEVEYNPIDNSYTLTLILNVSEDIMAAFSVSAKLSLTTKDGQIVDTEEEANRIVFYPTDYILNSVAVGGLANGRLNVAINKTSKFDFVFTTDNENNDLTPKIYEQLLEYAKVEGVVDAEKIAKLFSYYSNGKTITFADKTLHPEFEFNLINNEIPSILGLSQFANNVTLNIWFGYTKGENGIYSLNFGQNEKDEITQSLNFNFNLNIFPINEENEITIYSADEIYNSTTGAWNLIEGVNYVLMNDIELERVVPITTQIGQFDGNNRVISIKSFAVNAQTSNFGLFGEIGTYKIKDPITEIESTKPTLLKNVIVDYSKFEGTLAVNNNTTESIVFGGLVGTNNGGLIYNCDVINLNPSANAQFDLIVSNNASVVFGGLVGNNGGIITNSRVGRDDYTRIIATKTTESSTTKRLGGFEFEIYNSKSISNNNNQFQVVAGGLVGVNTGTISTSYVSNTNLVNYSTNELKNKTAGFVGENKKAIAYSYAKADDSTISTANPYSTGYLIENKGNGIVAGFVYSNDGTINNSYANIELKTKSAYIAGFVYENNGTISESYAACTMNSGDTDSMAEQPFVGVDNAGILLSNGTLKNTYYLMRTNADTPFKQGNKDVAAALNLENFQDSEHLVGFAFILSNVKSEREQGIWSYYTTESKRRLLPELMNANVVAHSYRYVVDNDSLEEKLVSAVSYTAGSANNPYIIKDVKDYNNVFTNYGQSTRNQVGYIRFINDINFNNEETAIQTRTNYTLGYDPEVVSENNFISSATKTSVDGNGLKISGIYLDVDNEVVSEIGLFAKVQNAYIKNLNLEFATPTTNGQFSTTTATYSGGLAGKIVDSVILNVTLHGENTTLTGSNFVGGLAGLISGKSLVYGIETNLYVKASATESYLYYNETDYKALNIQAIRNLSYNDYLKKLSYAGGIAGVLDLTTRSNVEYNVQFINVRGDQMSQKVFEGKQEANIYAEYAGGVAGYASRETSSFRLKYYTGNSELLRGDTAVGGLYGVCLGTVLASQVTAEEDTQYNYDTAMGEYIIDLANDVENSTLNTERTGNLSLLEGYGAVGGLVGVGLNAKMKAVYSKVGIKSGVNVGGLIGLSVSSVVSYSYAIPFINSYDGYQNVGGLFGSAYGISSRSIDRNGPIAEYEALLKSKISTNISTDIQFTYSTLIVDEKTFTPPAGAKLDFLCANYFDKDGEYYITSNAGTALTYVFVGTVNYKNNIVTNTTKDTSKASLMELYKLYDVSNSSQVVAFQEVFSGWSIVKYWSLEEERYFPLLIDKTVDNFIEIDHEDDLELIKSNPNGNFKVIKSFRISPKNANWIIETPFTGVLLGELENDTHRPTITIEGLTPQNVDTTGFFKETRGATITNLQFVWESPINLSKTDVTMVSGLTCVDNSSLISNVEVRTSYLNQAESEGYILNDSAKTIAGFGGIVGDSTNTNILGCNFIGKVKANLSSTENAVNVGGIVGVANVEPTPDAGANPEDPDVEENKKEGTVINDSHIGSPTAETDGENGTIYYSPTKFDLTIVESNTVLVHIGGIVGRATKAAIATNSVGGANNDVGYKYCDVTLTLVNVAENIHVGGVVGYADDGQISNCDVLSNILVLGTTSGNQPIQIGGLAGTYHLGNPTLTSGIFGCSYNGEISTVKETDKLVATAESTIVSISAGVAVLSGTAKMQQCLLSGSINTEGSEISVVYAGGAAARIDTYSDIDEVTTYVDMIVGTDITTELYVGGIVGKTKGADISYVSSWGRIVPITISNVQSIYAGGLIGLIEKNASVKINNSYTISSIIADSIAASAIQNLNIGALFGSIEEQNQNAGTENVGGEEPASGVTTTNVYYSSDYALCADENYNGDVPYGSNLSAPSMAQSSIWHESLQTENGTKNQIWTNVSPNRMPHLAALTEKLKLLDIINSVTNDYNLGSAMLPKEILSGGGNASIDVDKYQYYLLIAGANKVVPKFNAKLNGILIGQDETFEVSTLSKCNGDDATEFSAVIPVVEKHSAVSNLHVKLNSTISGLGSWSGIIAGLNKGVVFNSSVQGDGVEVNGSGSLGLIASTNKGLISHSYSTAEIIKADTYISGIVYANGGKLLSNYFTGYIDSTKAVGIVMTFDSTDNFAYNNYMGGVVVNVAKNAFTGVEFGATGHGANNFIDSYSDIKYVENDPNILKVVKTADLMSDGLLDGEWYYTVKEGLFDESSKWFGKNYNYPIYRFNKLTNKSGSLEVDDWKYQLDTGTGLVENDTLSLKDRYTALTGDEKKEYYNNAYKIPHLGILTSVNALLNNSRRNYVLIYDINGEIPQAGEGSSKYVDWTAIGNTSTDKQNINGFNNAGIIKDEGGNTTDTFGFRGVFISNKYYSQMIADADDPATDTKCLITNLSGQGLFTEISNAYFGDINFGSFYNLQESGAIGTNIVADATVNNIAFVSGSVVEGVDSLDGGASNTYAGLFGCVDKDASLTINKVKLSDGSKGNYKLRSNSATAGLLVGKLSGTMILEKQAEETAFMAWFEGNKYAGGLVGDLAGGTITGKENIINISQSNADPADAKYTSVLGGVAGLVTGASTIENITVRLYSTSDAAEATVDINTNTFGGFVGEVKAATTMTGKSKLDIKGKQINFTFNDDGAERYYGLIAGLQEGNISVNSLEIANQAEDIFKITMSGAADAYNESSKNCGVGTFVGSQKGDLTIISYNAVKVMLHSKGIPNVGGVSGYYAGGNVSAPIIPDDANKESFILIGTVNVGGLFGYCDNVDLSKVTFESKLVQEPADPAPATANNNAKSLLNADMPFAVVYVDGSTTAGQNKNFGGLFGYWAGEVTETEQPEGSVSTAEDVAEPENKPLTIQNSNTIYISGVESMYKYEEGKITVEAKTNTPGYASNIGGIAGKMTASTNNIELQNKAVIFSMLKDDTTNKISNGIKTAEGQIAQITKAQNVGGVFGLVSPLADIEIHNAKNTASVYGYQNVGGIIGYVAGVNGKKVAIINEASVELTGDNLSFDGTLAEDERIIGAELKDGNQITGDITGVVNVGGAVGYAGSYVQISQVYSQANVYGNVNVGGLVGLAENATLTNNYIKGGEVEGQTRGQVKGVYYNKYNKVDKIVEKLFIPTSVGGLVGTATVTDSNVESEMKYNIVDGVSVLSSNEGGATGVVISTISNDMVSFEIGDANDLSDLNSSQNILNLDTFADEDKVVFNEIATGFGGFAGTIDSATIAKSLDNKTNANYMNNITINAQLGVNVGTYFGVYKITDQGIEIENDEVLSAPVLYTSEGNDAKVDGAYNIGGVVGLINAGDEGAAIHNLSNSNLKGSATIQLQTEFTGMYVGGLIGKTTSNSIDGLNMNKPIGSGVINITIDTSLSFYIGGVVGRAEVTEDARILLNNFNTDLVINDDKVTNFGGLLGMLKVHKGTGAMQILVEGEHHNVFTINTIENSNYAEGDSAFNIQEGDNGNIELYAQAYYVNLDRFDISASKTVPTTNPIYTSFNTGWHKDYTMFKTMQRCIPKTNSMKWDSVAIIYDAEHIKGVSSSGDDIIYTVYEEADGQAKLYAKTGIATILVDEKGNYFTSTSGWDGEIDLNKQDQWTPLEKAVVSKLGFVPNEEEVNLNLFSYEGNQYVFLTEKIFDSPSTSGSLFEVNGYTSYTNGDHQIGEKEPEGIPWWGWVLMALAVVAAGVITYFTGGAGAPILKAVLVTAFGVIKAAAVAAAALTIWSLALQLQAQKSTAERHFVTTYNQSEGFLSGMYGKDIQYKDGKVVGDTDDFLKIASYTYQPYSHVRPAKFNSERYVLVECEIKNKTGIGNYIVASEDSENIKVGLLHEYSKYGIYPIEIEDDEGNKSIDKTLTFDVVKGNNGKYYVVLDYYVYHAGQYWINTTAANVISYPSSDLFKVPKIDADTELTQNAYTQEDAFIYIHGKATRDNNTGKITYNFEKNYENYVVSNDKSTAKVKYDDTEYVLSSSVAVVKQEDKTYRYAASKMANWIENYDYIQGAYYTINGDSSMGLTKYATYTHVGEYTNLNSFAGLNPNVDYIYTSYQEDRNNDHIQETYYDVYKISSISETEPEGAEGKLVKPVYPSSFVNPYASNVSGIKDDKIYRAVGEDKTGISQRVEYYLYIGGFKVKKNAKDELKVFTETDDFYLTFDDGSKALMSTIVKTSNYDNKKWGEAPISKMKEGYIFENGTLYQTNNLYSIDTKFGSDYYGFILRNDIYYEEAKDDENIFNYGKYLSHPDTELYTRYKYTNNIALKLKEWLYDGKQYYLVPENYTNFTGWPNGRTTTFVEAVKVTLGNNCEIFLKDKTKFPTPITCGYVKSK